MHIELAWRNGRRNGLKIHRWKHHTSSSLVASISHMRHFIPWARMMKSVQEIAHSLYFSFVCYASSTNDIWHYPQHRVFTFYKMVWLLVQLEEHLLQERVTGLSPVQSTRRRKYLIFCECTLMAEVTSKWS